MEFIAGVLHEPKLELKYVQIEVEEIYYVTSDGEESEEEEEPPKPAKRAFTLAQLKKKKTCKPFGGLATGKLTMGNSVNVTGTKRGYKYLDLLSSPKKQVSDKIFKVKGGFSQIIKLIKL